MAQTRMVLRAELIQQIVQQVMSLEEIFLGDMADFVSMEMGENTNNGKSNSLDTRDDKS